jgi:hypothetical protein
LLALLLALLALLLALLALLRAVSASFGMRSAALCPAVLDSSAALDPAARVACRTAGFSAAFRPSFTICS